MSRSRLATSKATSNDQEEHDDDDEEDNDNDDAPSCFGKGAKFFGKPMVRLAGWFRSRSGKAQVVGDHPTTSEQVRTRHTSTSRLLQLDLFATTTTFKGVE